VVKLRLSRGGKKKKPIYKIVAADSRFPRDGRIIEVVGQYNPNINPIGIELKETILFRWLKNGAQPTNTVRSLLQRKGLWLRWHLMRKGVDEATMKTSMERWQLAQPEKLVREAAKRKRRKAKLKKAAEQPAVASTSAE